MYLLAGILFLGMSHECHNSNYSVLVVCLKTSFTFLSSKDLLRISDGMGETFGPYCGNKTGERLFVTGDQVELMFKSDNKVEQRGYHLVFTLIPLPSVSSPSVSPPSVSSLFNSHGKWDHKKAD